MQIDFSKVQNTSLAEVGQAINNRYQLCNREGDTIYPMHVSVKCRDFLNEVYGWKHNLYKRERIYGFDPVKMRLEDINFDVVRLLISDYTSADLDYIKSIVDITFPGSMIMAEKVKHAGKDYLYFEFTKDWIQNTVRLSFLTFIIRLSYYSPDNRKEHNQDTRLLGKYTPEQVAKAIASLPDRGYSGYYQDSGMSAIHNYSGFSSAIHYPKYNKYGTDLLNALSSL